MQTIFLVDYGGMNPGQIAAWMLIATLAGLLARWLVRGRKILGLWGDAVFGLAGAFVVGALLRAVHIDFAALIRSWAPAYGFEAAVWIDIAASALMGALLLRLLLRPVTGGPKKHPAHY
jgi:uncharacterized membrane protein YeaQ/YmgE (transglycosylase-associated protein family)